ncbi:MAG TPA: flavin reductase family protein [Bacteroidales bacterium]
MIEIDPNEYGNHKLHQLMLRGIAPRPIAFASTVDKDGNPNLSPFSFFNAFGVNPTTLIFSPSRRGRDNTTKHTLENLKEVPEVVINAVTYNMVQQMSLSSTEYPKGVNEFLKSGFTPIESTFVNPFRVKESPLQFECKVREIIETGGQAGSANLVVCEILHIHLDEKILDENGEIDTDKIDLVGRMGGNYYVRTSGDSKFIVPKPSAALGIGVDSLPEHIRLSTVLTGNDLGQLGNLEKLPEASEIIQMKTHQRVKKIVKNNILLHQYARELIASGNPHQALTVLMTEVY